MLASTPFATMSDDEAIVALVVTQAGRQALEIIKAGGTGRVAALFERSFYIAFDWRMICLGTSTLPMGPLNVRSSAGNSVRWEFGCLHIDYPVWSSPKKIRVGQALEFHTTGAIDWHPPLPPPWTTKSVKSGLAGLDSLIDLRSDQGLAAFVPADPALLLHDWVVASAHQPIRALFRAVERAFAGGSLQSAELDEPVIALLGHGPGLTPSGDDFLGGMLITLKFLKALGLRNQLFAVIKRHAPQRTNAISVAHLRAAGTGAGHEALHDVLNSLLCGDMAQLPAHLVSIGAIGHSSGWDALAGVCVTLRAYLAAEETAVICYRSRNEGDE